MARAQVNFGKNGRNLAEHAFKAERRAQARQSLLDS